MKTLPGAVASAGAPGRSCVETGCERKRGAGGTLAAGGVSECATRRHMGGGGKASVDAITRRMSVILIGTQRGCKPFVLAVVRHGVTTPG